jgi:hypothetical protein
MYRVSSEHARTRQDSQIASIWRAGTCTRSPPTSVTYSFLLAMQTPEGKLNLPRVELWPPPRLRTYGAFSLAARAVEKTWIRWLRLSATYKWSSKAASPLADGGQVSHVSIALVMP